MASYGVASFDDSIMGAAVCTVDVINNRPSQQHPGQLAGNLTSAGTWTGYGFISSPRNDYVLVPNITGIVTTVLQFAVRVVIYLHKRNNRGRPAAPVVIAASA